jgi:hypothetical protein
MYGITAEVVSVWRLRLKLTWLFRTFVMEQPDSSVEGRRKWRAPVPDVVRLIRER